MMKECQRCKIEGLVDEGLVDEEFVRNFASATLHSTVTGVCNVCGKESTFLNAKLVWVTNDNGMQYLKVVPRYAAGAARFTYYDYL